MNLKRLIGTSTLAAGVGLAGVLGVGLGTASADPGQQCSGPNTFACQGNPQQWSEGGHDQGWPQHGGPAPQQGNQRGIDQGRFDHQSFDYNGQHVTPMQAGNGAGWGFWFLGQWTAL